MKRILSVLCIFALLFSLVSCSAGIAVTETAAGNSQTEENRTEGEKKPDGPIVYPAGFSAGYARVDITPKESVPIYDADSEGVRDPLYLSCTAVCDGENVALLMSADLMGIHEGLALKAADVVEKEFGIPAANIIIGATHSHSALTAGTGSDPVVRWSSTFYKQLRVVVDEALRDLAPAEAFAGVSHTEGLTFVRRYLLADGTYRTNPSDADKPVAHESEADNELRTIRLARNGKKDILMVNYQTHYGYYSKQISADFVGLFRTQAEKEWDAHFVYYSGASGNLNFNSKIPGERKYESVPEGMVEFMQVTGQALSSEEKVNTGTIRGYSSQLELKIFKDTPERVAQAKETANYEPGTPEYTDRLIKYNLGSENWVNAILYRNTSLGETDTIPIHGISFGDIAFSTSPVEQFDQSAKDVRAASPFKMTFTLSLTNGSFGYVPTAEAFPHGTYEANVCRFIPGSGEAIANEQIRLLNECYNAK